MCRGQEASFIINRKQTLSPFIGKDDFIKVTDIFIHIKLNKSFNDNDTQVLSNKGFPISDKIKKKKFFWN